MFAAAVVSTGTVSARGPATIRFARRHSVGCTLVETSGSTMVAGLMATLFVSMTLIVTVGDSPAT